MTGLLTGALAAAVASGAVIVLAALGELLAERSGVQNLGLEGIMAMGAVTAVIVASASSHPGVALIGAVLMGIVLGALFAVATVTFKANQVLCGLGMAFLGTGLAARLGSTYSGTPVANPFHPIRIPVLADIPYLGEALFHHSVMVYFAYLVLPALVAWLLYRTRHGMNLRAAGENPAAADVCGVSVDGMRFLYSCVCGAFAAAGGAYLTLAYTPAWSESVTSGRGWIAIALVIFSAWRPWPVVLGALLFGAVTSLGFVAQILNWGIPPEFLSALPYLSTIALMVIPLLTRARSQRRMSTAPSALGMPYNREGS
jgi:general nucleoside transport system permease protein